MLRQLLRCFAERSILGFRTRHRAEQVAIQRRDKRAE
jgi:hypothetical protein